MTHPWKPDPAPPDYKELGLDGEFARLVRRQAKILEAAKFIESEKAANATKIKALLEGKGDKTRVDNFKVTVVPGKAPSSKIDGERLLRAGVSAKTIQDCTVHGQPGKPYILVTDTTKPRGKGQEQEAEAA